MAFKFVDFATSPPIGSGNYTYHSSTDTVAVCTAPSYFNVATARAHLAVGNHIAITASNGSVNVIVTQVCDPANPNLPAVLVDPV